jgi:flagellar basal body-associated protein FliL
MGVDWGGAAITLTSTDQTDSDGDGAEQQADSDSKTLYNVGIIAAIIVILLSGAAIVSMMRNPKDLEASFEHSDEQKSLLSGVLDETKPA